MRAKCLRILLAALFIVLSLLAVGASTETIQCEEAVRHAEELTAKGHWQEAIDTLVPWLDSCEAALPIVQSSQWRIDAWETLLDHSELPAGFECRVYLRAGLLSKAAQCVETRLAEPPELSMTSENQASVWITKARLEQASGDRKQARQSARNALRYPKVLPEVYFWASSMLLSERERLLQTYLERGEGEPSFRLKGVQGALARAEAIQGRKTWVPLNKPERVVLPLQLLKNREGATVGWVVPLKIKGRRRPLRALLDSGSPGVYLLERSLKQAKVERLANETMFGGGGSGASQFTSAMVERLQLGTLSWKQARVSLTQGRFAASPDVDAIVGFELFQGYRMTFDSKSSELLLEQDPQQAVPAHAFPFWRFAGQWLVGVTTDHSAGVMVFDTGASRTVLGQRWAKRSGFKVEGESRVTGAVGEHEGALRYSPGEIQTFGQTFMLNNPAGVNLDLRSQVLGVELAGFLGWDVLAEHTWVIDTTHQRIWIKQSSN